MQMINAACVKYICRCAFVAAAVVSASSALADQEQNDNIIASFPIDGTGDVLMIPVTIDDRTYTFTVDTGCSTTVVDRSLQHLLTRSPHKCTWNGKSTVDVFELNRGTLGGSGIRLPKWVFCFDLSDLRASSGYDERGVIGMDVLQYLVIQLNFDEGRMLFLRSSAGAPGHPIPIRPASYDRPAMTLTLPDLGDTEFVIDTGYSGDSIGSLRSQDFERLTRGKAISCVQTVSTATLIGRVNTRSGIVRAIALNEWQHGRLALDESVNDVNLLGLGYLSRFTVTLDFRMRTAFFAKGSHFDRHIDRDPLRDGLTLGKVAGRVTVIDVDQMGRGYLAGIRKGDQILEIGARSIEGLSLLAVTRMIYDPSADLDLLIRRANRDRQVIHFSLPPVKTGD